MAYAGFDLDGRVALVTGGSRGLGRAMARGLAEAGADVVVSARHAADLEAALEGILEGTGRRGATVVADLARREEVARLAEEALAAFGRIDILVNNAGINVPQDFDAIEDGAWDEVLAVDLTACMALTRALVPQMRERGWGRVVNISSVLGLAALPRRGPYCAAKAGLIGMAKAAALELGAHGITVNCIAPGLFATDMPKRLLTEEQRRALVANTALGRWGEPEELVGPLLLLVSDAGSYITGEVLVVDGGALARAL